ncbi:UNVERIFIED_CONTAM: hypothetical protein Sindi_1714100 [Sesamum indicum]
MHVVFFEGNYQAHNVACTHQMEERSMCHPFNVEICNHFDRMYPNFAEKPRNVQLGFCTNSFAPHGQYSRTYSSWPVIVRPYNLFPDMCMSSEYIFLTMVIPSPSNPKRRSLEPLIEELLQLWDVGVRTYNNATDNAFIMQEALMWTMNYLPAHGMASGYSIVGVMSCLICMDDTRAFYLQHGRKVCYFDCYKQFLPEHHPYQRNKKAFTKNFVEHKVACPRLTGNQFLD